MNAARKYDILNNHNDYDISIPRSDLTDIRRDPFNLGNAVKGLANVNHERNLSSYAEDLVATYAKYHGEQYHLLFSDLPEDEQNELLRLYIEFTDREIGECVYGDDFSVENDYTCALLAMLKDDCPKNREQFAAVTRKNIITYYLRSLQEVLDDACHNYLHSLMNEEGYYAHQDRESGEIQWNKY